MTNTKNKISTDELLQAFIFIGLGLFFLYQAQLAETNQEGLVGPALVPSVVSALIICLGMIKGVRAIYSPEALDKVTQDDKLGLQVYLKLTTIILVGFFYVWAFTAFGYLLATFMTFLAILFIFGNRNVVSILLYGIIGSLSYYYVFVKLMKIYDPPGELLNIQSVFPF